MSVHSETLSYDDYAQGILHLAPDEQIRIITMVLSQLQLTASASLKPKKSKLKNLKPRRLINGDPEELINLKVWEWNESNPH